MSTSPGHHYEVVNLNDAQFDAVDLSGEAVEATTPVVAGPPGPGGTGGTGSGQTRVFEYLMPVAQTTALITHDLGHDPVGVQVVVDGTARDEYSVSFPIPGETVLIGFDVTVQALIRLI